MNGYLTLFLILLSGYALGSVKVRGLQLGSAGVLLTALFAGHWGGAIPEGLGNFGLICFVTSVGLMAGPVFFRSFKQKSCSYLSVGLVIALSGIGLSYLLIRWGLLSPALAVGLVTGALTSTPGLAAGVEALGDPLVSVGYGVAYPFGVVAVVLFVQLTPKLLPAALATPLPPPAAPVVDRQLLQLDPLGLTGFVLAAILGVLLGQLAIPLPNGASFSLGLAGGPMFAGLFVGHCGSLGPVSLRSPKTSLDLLREIGMVLFLASAGVEAGSGFVAVVRANGFQLFAWGALLTMAPMLLGFGFAYYLLKLDLRSALGTVCGGMTSTPSLGALLNSLEQDETGKMAVSVAYASAYPIALVVIVLSVRIIPLLFS